MRKNKIITFLRDLLFPAFCVGCKKEGGFLCATCKMAIVIRRVPSHAPKKHGIKILYAATEYHTPVIRDLIARYKYEFAKEIAPDLTDILFLHLAFARFTKDENHIIVPVPLHARRERWRGFNQAALIAKNIAHRFTIPFCAHTLKRVKNTTPQIEMRSRAQRLENIHGAFACANAQEIRGKAVILVDDVATTGETLAECAKTLKQAGARSVVAFVVAQ